ncbi:MAG TPA: hypothetical protein VG944_16695 [Fimbriimonas sp.]|nr:hypothetical protein [Fimbriimonas sp.]
MKDRCGRVVTKLTNFHVTPLFDEPLLLRRLTPDGIPEVILATWSGGAHASNTYYVWALSKKPRCLLAYFKENVGDLLDFDVVHLGAAKTPQIRSWYDGFGHYEPDLPIVFRFERGRYQDETPRYRDLLDGLEDRAWRDLAHVQNIDERSLHLVALSHLRGNYHQVLNRLKRAVPPATYRWLKASDPLIRAILKQRYSRYRYPCAYDLRPVHLERMPGQVLAGRLEDSRPKIGH